MIYQHASPPEAHHAEAALEGEAVVVCGGDARLEGLGAADAVSLLGLPLGIMHPLHVFPQFVFSLKLFPTRRTQEVFAVRVSEHVETQFIRTAEGLVTLCTLVYLLRVEAAHVFFHLDKIWETFFTSWAGEVAIIDMNGHMIFQQIKAVKGFWAKNARVSLLVGMELHVALQGRAADEALVTEITGQRAVPLPPMETQVLVQLVLFTKGLPTLQAFKRPEGFPNKQMLKSCISDALGSAHVVCRQRALGRHHALFVLWLQMEGVSFGLMVQRGLGFRWQRRDWDSGLFWLIQPIQGSWFVLLKLLLAGKM